MIKGLHHAAYRCRDSEETRKFYEDFLGLPLINAFEITETKTGRATHVLHSFYAMDDGSCLAFFEVCGDDLRDGSETFALRLLNPAKAELGRAAATGTIAD